jgi:hypothetical protein
VQLNVSFFMEITIIPRQLGMMSFSEHSLLAFKDIQRSSSVIFFMSHQMFHRMSEGIFGY